MSDVALKNMLFDRATGAIKQACSEIETCTHLFDRTRRYDTGLEKLDLRQSVKDLRACATLIERIERRLKSAGTSFPDHSNSNEELCQCE